MRQIDRQITERRFNRRPLIERSLKGGCNMAGVRAPSEVIGNNDKAAITT
jgi:hypothetical protein